MVDLTPFCTCSAIPLFLGFIEAGVPLAALIGIPLYSNAAGVIPLVSALTEKGVSIGTTLAFMMAVTGLSLNFGNKLWINTSNLWKPR